MAENRTGATMPRQILTTVVGSYPVPAWLVGNTSRVVLRDAVMAVLKTQELAGLDVISDGELQRFDPSHPETNGMIDYFVSRMEGIRTKFSRSDLEKFRSDGGLNYRMTPAGIVEGKVGEGSLNLRADYEFAQALTKKPLKFTCTGPHMLAKVLTSIHYKRADELAMDIADVLARQLESIDSPVVQLDEANISGHPEEGKWAAAAINHVLKGIRAEKAVHVCFGNYGGQTIQKGFWKELVPFLNSLHADHVLLEFARRGYDELPILRELDPKIGLGIGVVDIKDNEVESPEVIARRIDRIVRTVGEDRLQYVHPDCGLWMLHRSVADRKLTTLVEGRNLFLGSRRQIQETK
jgi:5-methyltetrahydropteroyltriglutamate--homocysteine methyltransferase